MLQKFLFLLFALSPLLAKAQSYSTIYIVDEQNEGIPFVNYSDHHTQRISDINGAINLLNLRNEIVISSFGYQDTTFQINELLSDTIQLQANFSSLNEVTILPGINPAIRIIQNASKNRKKNAPNSTIPYRVNSYSKFVFSLDSLFDVRTVNLQNDSLYQRLNANKNTQNKGNNTSPKIDDNADSLLSNFLKQSHLMLMESASTKEFVPLYHEKEVIHAYRISGMNLPELANFANSIQSFSFYENTFDVLGSSYLNPIATGANRKYAYILENSIVNETNDTTFIIRFFPKKGKEMDGLFGTLFISSNQWAIEKVIAQPIPEKDKLFFVKIIQEYEFINDLKWFPTNLYTEFYTPILELNGKTLNGKGKTHYKNIELNPDLKKQKSNSVLIETTKNAGNTNEAEWNTIRDQKLTDKEANTYLKIDSLSKDAKFEQKIKLISSLLEGKIPIKYVNLDLTKVIDYNLYEGYRLGLGLETSERVSKLFTLAGYFAYGTSDRLWKYGGSVDFLLHRKNNVHIQLSYKQDLIDRGMMHFSSQPYQFSFNSYYADFYTNNKDKQQDIQFLVYGKIVPNLQIGASVAYEDIRFSDDYVFILPSTEFVRKLRQFNISSEIVWTPGAKWSLFGDKYFKIRNNFPEFRFKVSKTISDNNYWRFKLDIHQQHKIFRVGDINWLITGSKTLGDVPLFAMNTANATGGNFNLSVPNSFETMLPGSVYASQYIAGFIRYTTENWRTKIKFIQPSLSVHQAIGWGTMEASNRHSNEFTFHSMEKGYYETGLVINQLIYISNLGIGIGAFYHYGPYSFSKFEKNLTYKISLLFSIK